MKKYSSEDTKISMPEMVKKFYRFEQEPRLQDNSRNPLFDGRL